MFLWSAHVYGPVRSRRLGVSLGVNVLPVGKKLCSYDCPYCECGFTRGGVALGDEARLPGEDEVVNAIERALRAQPHGEPIESITFAGNGEPTLHPRLPSILGRARELRDALAPGARVAVLTNGIRLREPLVREAVLATDEVEVKLDAGTEATFARVAAPTVPWTLADLRALLLELGERVSLQTCLFQGRVDNTAAADLAGMLEVVAEARPRRVLAYTLDRLPADPGLAPAPRAVLEGFVDRVKGVGVPAELY